MKALLKIFNLDETYIIKWAQETGYAIILGVAGVIAITLQQTDWGAIQDWKTWIAGLGVACTRVAYATLSNAVHSLFGPKGG